MSTISRALNLDKYLVSRISELNLRIGELREATARAETLSRLMREYEELEGTPDVIRLRELEADIDVFCVASRADLDESTAA